MGVDKLSGFLENQGLSDESIDDILEHFGKKGMRWGQRKSTKSPGPGRSNKAREKAKKTLVKGLIVSPIAAAGAMYAGKLWRDRGLAQLRASTLQGTTSKIGKKATLALMEAIPYGDFVRPLRRSGDE